jgi:peptide/nickel transport system substrate-binding protein
MDLSVKPIVGDVAAAKKLMVDAGYAKGFSIELWTPNGTYLKDNEQAQAIQPMLKLIGIDAKIKAMDYAAYSDGLRRHEGQLFVLGWAHTTTPDGFYRGVFLSTASSNWSSYKNGKVDGLINKAVAETSSETALKTWRELEQMLVDDAAGVPISYSSLLYVATKKVHDFYPTAFGMWDIKSAWIE